VPIWAFDARHGGGGALHQAHGDGGAARPRPAGGRARLGRLVVADERSPLAVLFGDLAPDHCVTSHTNAHDAISRCRCRGSPRFHVEEAIYTCVAILTEE